MDEDDVENGCDEDDAESCDEMAFIRRSGPATLEPLGCIAKMNLNEIDLYVLILIK